jgi:hypothetical protein
MTTYLPYRGNTFCSLGHLIDGQFADTYLQQAGLIFCRGSIRLAGIYRPDIGSVVDFAYTRNNATAARIPRRLRVLSSFADPFTNITTVQLGCKLSLLQENRQPESVTPEDSDPTLPAGWQDYIAPPVDAAFIAARCLVALDITAAGFIPLGNRYTQDAVDLSTGYVEVLGKLLESENFVGWLNEEEELEVRPLIGPDIALGPVFNNTNVFTLSPIGVGSLPGEAVSVTFSPMRLNDFSITVGVGPSLGTASGWNGSTTFGFPVNYSIAYDSGGPQTFTGSYIPVQQTQSTFNGGVMVRSITSTGKPYAAVAGKYASQALSNGLSVPTTPVGSRTTTVNRYDRQGRVVETTVTETQSLIEFAGALDLTFVFSDSDFVSIPDSGEVITQRTITQYLYNTNAVRREVHRYSNWGLLQTGQQAVNEGRSAFSTSSEVSDYINTLLGEPAYVGTEVSISDAGPQAQRTPGPSALFSQVYGNGERRSQVTETAYIFGSSTAQRTVNFTLPYTNDDYVYLDGGVWRRFQNYSQAEITARNYGRIQNRLRLGNSQGVSLQVPVELMPTSPFDALYLQAGGLTGQYRANGMSWTFDQNGIVGQVDALFWLAIGQTGTPGPVWFPMPPAVSVLPATPSATVNGSPVPANSGSVPGGWNPAAPDLGALFGGLPTVTPPVFPSTLEVESGLEPFAETVAVDAVTRSVFVVEEFPYSLAPQADAMELVSTAVFDIEEAAIVVLTSPLASFTFAALVPEVYAPGYVPVPLVELTFASLLPEVTGSGYVDVPGVQFTVAAPLVAVAAAQIINVPLSALTFDVPVPLVGNAPDANFANVSLLVPMTGIDGSTTFTDVSSFARTIIRTAPAEIDDAIWPFAGAGSSGLFGSSGRIEATLDTALGTGDWTIECFPYVPSRAAVSAIVTIGRYFQATGLIIYINNSGNLACFSELGSFSIASTAALTVGTWPHVAVVKSSGTITQYISGTADGSASNSQNLSEVEVRIAAEYYNTTYGPGLISNIGQFRITRGVARYTASFSPPTVPFPIY